MKASDRANEIQEYFFSKKLAEIRKLIASGKDIINLGIGSPDLKPSAIAIDSFSDSLREQDAFKYQSYKGIPELTDAIQKWYKEQYGIDLQSEMDIIPLIGSKEGLHFLSLAYLNPGDEALIPNPGYPAYSSAIKIAGASPIAYDLNAKSDWHPDLDSLKKLVNEKTKIIFINYPHMPTGQKADRDKLSELIEFAKNNNILICNDNPYSHTLAEKPFSIFQISGAMSHCIELNSCSKSHSYAGARVGMIIGLKKWIDPVFKIQSSFSSGMFKPIQKAAIVVLENSSDYTKASNQIYRKRRTLVQELFQELNCTYSTYAEGMFVWAKIPSRYKNGEELSDHLLYNANVFITPGIVFGTNGEKYLRASLCQTEDQIKECTNRIKSILETK